jgi:hypothetical protein
VRASSSASTAGVSPAPIVGYGASAQAGQRVSLVPPVGDSAGQFQGPLVTLLSPRKVAAYPAQRCSAIEGVGLAAPVAEVAVDAQGLRAGLV